METLPKILLWLGIICIPLSWMMWYVGPGFEPMRPVLAGISDPALRTVLQEAHAERWGIFVGLWPVTLLVASYIIEKQMPKKG